MIESEISFDTKEFEVSPELDPHRALTAQSARRICGALDRNGFVILPGMLNHAEADSGMRAIRAVLDDPSRENSAFASEIDIKYHRRDFCPLPANGSVLQLAALLCQRSREVLTEYCGLSRSVLEISTLTSYQGASHQYIHRDPTGVIGILSALGDVSPEQGGTLFVPGSHKYCGGEFGFGGYAQSYMEVFQSLTNSKIMRYNIASLKKMRRTGIPPVSRAEYLDRLYSPNTNDNHQPNIYQFLGGNNEVFDRTNFGPRSVLRMLKHRKKAMAAFRLVQVSPAKGTVVIYRSDVFHAGPDNRSELPRYLLSINLARDMAHPKLWEMGYAPHKTLLENPLTLDDLLNLEVVPRA